ncbi:hypothetical protein [Comamonas odontotermitis]|uniref:hypothetical protein n=1 Tax=Comamonas odontotermitis TaxID=379895 RepID=UPI003750EABA
MKKSSVQMTILQIFKIHLVVSGLIAICAWLIVEKLLFPYPFAKISGGAHLLLIIILVDVICGPVLTLVLFNSKKSKNELVADFLLIALLQLSALSYGFYSAYVARPIAIVFENDRFVVVSDSEIDEFSQIEASNEYKKFKIFERVLVGIRSPVNSTEENQNISLSLAGLDPSLRPSWWQPYNLSQDEVMRNMKGFSAFMMRMPMDQERRVRMEINRYNKNENELYYLPIVGRDSLDDYVVLLDKDANILGYIAANGWL